MTLFEYMHTVYSYELSLNTSLKMIALILDKLASNKKQMIFITPAGESIPAHEKTIA